MEDSRSRLHVAQDRRLVFLAFRFASVRSAALGPCSRPSSPRRPALGLSDGQADPRVIAIGLRWLW